MCSVVKNVFIFNTTIVSCSIMELYIDKTVGGDRYDKKDSSSSQLVMNTRPVQITTAVIQVSPLSKSLF